MTHDRSMDQGLADAVAEAATERVHVFDVPDFPVPGVGKCGLCLGDNGKPRVWIDLDGVTRVMYLCDGCESLATDARQLLKDKMPTTAAGMIERGGRA